jgi:hypothetical protein
MLEAADPWQELSEGDAIGVIDRFVLQYRLPERQDRAGPVPGRLAGPDRG